MAIPSLLSRAQVLVLLGNKSVSWLYERMSLGEFPRPIKLGGSSSVAWNEKAPFGALT